MKLPDSEGYILLYDFINEPPRLFFPLVFFAFAISGYLLIKSSLKPSSAESNKKGIIGMVGLLMGLCLGFWSLNLSDYFETRSIYKKGGLKVVSGPVTELIINNKGKNNSMEFVVYGQHFRLCTNELRNYGCTYSDFDYIHIGDSTFLKLAYFVKGGQNIILRAETK